ncbi:hypothetical protein AKH20_02990 [Pelagibacteraceae bacterium GOM-A3]|nr:hypothetical protein AKH20_02990 [Pelagibacteraceae bacterium GOM-A3]
MKNKKLGESEIDLIEVTITLINNKWKILLFSFLALVIMLIYYSLQFKTPHFLAVTEIRPISTFQESKYKTYNSYTDLTVNRRGDILKEIIDKKKSIETDSIIKSRGRLKKDEINFQQINKKYLLNLFIEKLNENEIFIDAIKKFNIIPKEKYKNPKIYEDEVSKLAASIALLPPDDFSKKDAKEKYWRIKFETSDKETWQNFLKYIQKPTNEAIREYLSLFFDELIQHEKKLEQFKLDEVQMRIENAYISYDREITRKLVFLKEQAEIARALNIPKNNLIEAQSFVTDTGLIANLSAQIPYYMRGFEMIEKEIDLIENRTTPEPFAKGLNKLEELKNELITNKDLENLETLFKETPIAQSDIFSAANIIFLSTKYYPVDQKSAVRMSIIALIIGALVGIFYVIFENAIRKRN